MMKLAILLVVGVIARQAYGDEPEAIVGGQIATRGQFPHQISLQYGSQHICGGSIISSTHILTAAHCVDGLSMNQMTVTSGAQYSSSDGETHKIKCIRMHPGYTGNRGDGWKDDIALITLAAPMTFNIYQKPIPLANKDHATGQHRGIISGWGKTSDFSPVSQVLRWTPVNVLSQQSCLAAHPNRSNGDAFTNRQHICVLEQRGTGACQGDSGGPLVVDGKLCGVTSWVAGCAKGNPDVYTNVPYYLGFISQSRAMCP